MSGVASDTGNMSPTIVAKIVIDNIIVTPAREESLTEAEICVVVFIFLIVCSRPGVVFVWACVCIKIPPSPQGLVEAVITQRSHGEKTHASQNKTKYDTSSALVGFGYLPSCTPMLFRIYASLYILPISFSQRY